MNLFWFAVFYLTNNHELILMLSNETHMPLVSKLVIVIALERSVKNAPKDLRLSTDLMQFFSIVKIQCLIQKPFLKPYIHFDSILPKICDICLKMHFPNILNKSGKIYAIVSFIFCIER